MPSWYCRVREMVLQGRKGKIYILLSGKEKNPTYDPQTCIVLSITLSSSNNLCAGDTQMSAIDQRNVGRPKGICSSYR